MTKTFKNFINLFWTWFVIGITTFGGGYAMIAIIQNRIVDKKQWITNDDLTKIIAIAESTPGPIAINSATYVGYKLLGVLGSVCATLGVVLPSFTIIFVISLFFNDLLQYEIVAAAFAGIKASVSALILLAGIKMFKSTKKNWLTYSVFGVALVLTLLINIFDWKVSSVFLIIAGAVIGVITVFASQRNQDGDQQQKGDKNNESLPLADHCPLGEEDKKC